MLLRDVFNLTSLIEVKKLNMDDRTVDTIFAGSLEMLPPVSSKIVRIFTSSTFTGKWQSFFLDMQRLGLRPWLIFVTRYILRVRGERKLSTPGNRIKFLLKKPPPDTLLLFVAKLVFFFTENS